MNNTKDPHCACTKNCTSVSENASTTDTGSLRTIRTLSTTLLITGLVSIATQMICLSLFHAAARSDGPYDFLETAAYIGPGWTGVLHILLGGIGCIAVVWPKTSLLMVTVSLAASLIPISVVALILSGYSFFVRSSLLDSFKFELVQSLLMVCNSLGFLNAVGIVVRVALDLCRANNEEENPSSSSHNSRLKSHHGCKQSVFLARGDLIGIRIFSIFTLNLGLLEMIVQTIAWLCLDSTKWLPFYQGFWSGIFNFITGCLSLRASCTKTKPMFTGMAAVSSISVAATFTSFMLSVLAIFTGYAQCAHNCVLWLSAEWLFVCLTTFAFSSNTVLAVLATAHLCKFKPKAFETVNFTQTTVFDPILMYDPLRTPTDSRTQQLPIERVKENLSHVSTNSFGFRDRTTPETVYYPRTGVLAHDNL